MHQSVDRSSVQMPTRDGRQTILLVAGFVVAWWFWESAWLFPLRMLVVAAHEASHALAAVLTGGEVVEVGLDWREGGHALTRGGSSLLVMNAGYLGSMLWGLALLALTRGGRPARGLSVTLGIGLVAMGLAWVRPVASFGFVYAGLAGFALVVVGWLGSHGVNRTLLRGVGLFSVLYAFLDIRDDVFLSGGVSDAALLAAATGVPALVWGSLWCLVGVAVVRLAWSRIR